MFTNIATQSPSQAGILRGHALSTTLLRPVGASLSKSRPGQQTRGFRFGIWSSYLDPETQRDLRRRHRMLKHKYAETIIRRLKWDHSPLSEDPRAILRRVVGRYCYPADVHTSRGVSSDRSARWYGNIPSGDNADDGRAKASSNNTFGGQFDSWKSELDSMVNSWTKQANKAATRAKSTSTPEARSQQGNTASPIQVGEDYVIDPITNRKVMKKSYGSFESAPEATPAETFKSYRSQFAMFIPPNISGPTNQQPVYSDGPPPPEELTKYNDVDVDAAADRLASLDVETQSEEYSLNHLPPEEAAEIREDVDKYNASEYDPVQSSGETHTQKYDDLHKYNPSQYDEVQATLEEPAEKYDDLHEYKAYRYNESATPAKDPSLAYDDLHKYRPYEHNESAQVERSTPQYADLDKYANFEQDEELNTDVAEEKYKDLDKYRPSVFSDRARVEESPAAYEDLDKYNQPFHHEEGKAPSEAQQKYDDLAKYQPREFDDPVEKPFEQYGDLNKYKAFRFQEPEGKAVLEKDIVDACLKDFDAKSETWEHLERSLSKHIAASDAADREAIANVQLSRQRSSAQRKSGMTGNFVRDFPEEFSSTWSETATGLQQEASAYEQQVQARVQNAEKTYSESLFRTANSAVLQPALDRQPQSKVDTTLKRSRKLKRQTPTSQIEIDPYSRPGPLETSYADECGSDSSGPSYVRNYGSYVKPVEEQPKFPEPFSAVSLDQLVDNISSSQSAQGTKSSTISTSTAAASAANTTNAASTSYSTINAKPTIYKILAYDPTMQNVSTAETTSVVPDQASPLTPAEVLLRLSNPIKFFPHFAPLATQGFEIVSGSGDVLVFRKTRDVVSPKKSEYQVPVNPIDMMGKPMPAFPRAAAFASPTGFVNYDCPPSSSSAVAESEEVQKSEGFKSSIHVRREEPVFNGPKTTPSEHSSSRERRKKRSFTKRILIGGVSVAGLSYALGVIGEYFATGGADGRGPTGF
ncbi:hypothetical protein BKA67DRAFT_1465 [Truncatella angustata]|uniref:Uncharacterized protein n=1 Tax=Truncatella angustata TaxID=152316 RepID=A0A9P9A362_9PEZI|nr:uncharacterized protein BKA67DRAFT_1465 [Truncatella angustata]KAH6658925.1 hypothetical protein BKA67DRAFT_1465 [Truncatella angustata]KAH8196250.1 hypothetical protein TruAng_009575 [Truncatella angustata]